MLNLAKHGLIIIAAAFVSRNGGKSLNFNDRQEINNMKESTQKDIEIRKMKMKNKNSY